MITWKLFAQGLRFRISASFYLPYGRPTTILPVWAISHGLSLARGQVVVEVADRLLGLGGIRG